jgi:hypothetical protein
MAEQIREIIVQEQDHQIDSISPLPLARTCDAPESKSR